MLPDRLFKEAQRLVVALEAWADAVHPEPPITRSMRAVLELLLSDGAQTVPAMARARGVSRQNTQQQVDGLLREGLVARRENPAHKRSVLIVLTDAGRALAQTMRAEELHALSRLQAGVSDHAIAEAGEALAAWRKALQADSKRRAEPP